MTRLLLFIVCVLSGSGTVVVGLPALLPPAVMNAPATAGHVGSGMVVVGDGLRPLFPDVPSGGYPHDTYTTGNCTWWVAFNRPVPPYLGDAWRWLTNAAAAGMRTSAEPSIAAIVIYRASPGYDVAHGHVAIVMSVGSDSFRVSEMNFVGLGLVDERDSPWPDWHVEGFIPR